MKSTTIRRLWIPFSFVIVFCVGVFALPGDSDTTFDTDGITTANIAAYDYATAVAIQPDGKIVVAGYSDVANPAVDPDISLARFNADGTPDLGFGTSGGTVFYAEPGNQRITTILILPDGKILAVGIYNGHLGIYRFNSNGSRDTGFGTNGIVTHVFGEASAGNDAVLQPDGKLVIGGFTDPVENSQRFTIFRVNPDGSFDTSFNSTGYNIIDDGGTTVTAIALQNDGRIVFVGRFVGLDLDGYLGRLSANGILEGSADDLWKCNVSFRDLVIQPDGKIVVSGQALFTGDNRTVTTVVRFHPNLTFDFRFGSRGMYSVLWGAPGRFHQGNSLFLEPDGRIIIAGRADMNGNVFRLAIARLNAHGYPDIGFGNGGIVTTPTGQITRLARQPDGKIVGVGFNETGSGSDYVVARYNVGASNTFPTKSMYDWDGDGRADIAVYRPSTAEWYILRSFNFSVGIQVFGLPNDTPIPADWDGDSRTDHAVVQNGFWWKLPSSGGGAVQHFFTVLGTPRPGDFNADGAADIITYEPGWWKRRTFLSFSQNSDLFFHVGGDKPVLGDFDGDTAVDPTVYRPSTGTWLYNPTSSTTEHRTFRWGIASDIPTPGDFDGDFKTDFAVYRPGEGNWYIYNSSDGSYTITRFGLAEDRPVPADYDGDGKADIALFRPSTGVWYLLQSTNGFAALQWGLATDVAIPNAYVAN